MAKSLCFLRASVGDVRHFGFGRFGTAPQSSGSAMGWLVWQNLFVFLGPVGDVRHFGFGRFGTAPQSSGSAMSWLVFLRAYPPPGACKKWVEELTNGPSLSRTHPNFRGVGGMGGSP